MGGGGEEEKMEDILQHSCIFTLTSLIGERGGQTIYTEAINLHFSIPAHCNAQYYIDKGGHLAAVGIVCRWFCQVALDRKVIIFVLTKKDRALYLYEKCFYFFHIIAFFLFCIQLQNIKETIVFTNKHGMLSCSPSGCDCSDV